MISVARLEEARAALTPGARSKRGAARAAGERAAAEAARSLRGARAGLSDDVRDRALAVAGGAFEAALVRGTTRVSSPEGAERAEELVQRLLDAGLSASLGPDGVLHVADPEAPGAPTCPELEALRVEGALLRARRAGLRVKGAGGEPPAWSLLRAWAAEILAMDEGCHAPF